MAVNPRRMFGVSAAGAIVALGAAYYAVWGAPVRRTPYQNPPVAAPQANDTSPTPKVAISDDEWKKRLSPAAFDVTRRAGTEPAFSHPYAEWHQTGVFRCVDCGLELFSSRTKFESGTGWPSFWAPIAKDRVTERADNGFGMVRTEVLCARCGAHLGHVFDDGPRPTGLRYCMNGTALTFKSADTAPAPATVTKK